MPAKASIQKSLKFLDSGRAGCRASLPGMTLIDHVERGKDLRRPGSETEDDDDLLIDSTRAVEPLDRTSFWDTGELPETGV